MGSNLEQDLCGSRVVSLVGACESMERLASIHYFLVEKEIHLHVRRFKEAETVTKGT